MKKFNSRNIRTDIALETHQILTHYYESDNIDGVKMRIETNEDKDIKVTWIEVLDEKGAEEMNQPIGKYVTIECLEMKIKDVDAHKKIIKLLAAKLNELYDFKKETKILIVGLGNWNITADALGPKVISKILVTRHIRDTLFENIQDGVSEVSCVSPGVMGLTGIETAEIVKGIVSQTKPDVVIAVDALASRSVTRLNSTIQMNNTGINPGSGLGNKRAALNKKNLGAEVIGLGVPTVVNAVTLVNDTIENMIRGAEQEGKTSFFETSENWGEDNKYNMIKEILEPYTENMFVTPKEIDDVIENLSNIIANGLNIGLHQGLSESDINRFVY